MNLRFRGRRRPTRRAIASVIAGLLLLPVLLAAGDPGKSEAEPTPPVASGAGTLSMPENPHGSFREDCSKCHRPEAWKPTHLPPDFDHARYGFPLAGAHRSVPCLMCHTTAEFTNVTGTRCADCHSDVHVGQMGMDCARCHSERDFIDRAEAVRTHRASRFPLTGAHLTTDCADCHRPEGDSAMRFANMPTDCEGCHLADYQAAANPNHAAQGFPTDCGSCHATFAWAGGAFDHDLTGFPLTGAHRGAECAQCHGTGPIAAVSTACVSCHRADYDGTADPSHASVGFPTDCERCHSTASWEGASFDHSVTGFALTGAHRPLQCAQCHGATIGPLASTCVSCHQADYDGTTDPSHASAGFATDCQRCHSTVSWDGATFDHAATGFALTGAHTTVQCAQCHGATIGPLPSACASCHQADFDGTTDPNHAASGFSTDCASCHDTNGWDGATFDHDASFFPIYSGAHRGKWTSCADCHVNEASYSQFECILCHEHSNRTEVDNDHRGESGYAYDSAACYRCHPRGRS
jgi:hypothetical protein